jgi:hypothetical protein
MDTKFPEFDEVNREHRNISADHDALLRGRLKKRKWFQGRYGYESDERVVKSRTVCKFYASTGRCRNGTGCIFLHVDFSDSSGRLIDEPCKFLYTTSHGCKKGDDCHFSHELGKFACPLAFGPKTRRCSENCSFSHTEQHDELSKIAFAKLYKVYLRSLGQDMEESWGFYLDELSETAALESRTRKCALNFFNHSVGSHDSHRESIR